MAKEEGRAMRNQKLGKARRRISVLLALAGLLLVASCTSHAPLATVDSLDLERYMGDWYVIANIPTFVEKGAVNAIEHYDLRDDGDVDITFTFFKNNVEGKFKEMHARGFVQEGTGNARWKVQFIWPLKSPFYVMDLDENYNYTVIGLPSRDYLWIMAREPLLPDSIYSDIVARTAEAGYDTTRIQKVLQMW